MSSTGGDRTSKQRWVLFPSSLKKVLLPHPLWYLPITITGAWHRSLFFHTACFYFSVKHRFCFTTLLPHRTATSILTEQRLGVAVPAPSLLHQQVISFSFWLSLDVSLSSVKAHVILGSRGRQRHVIPRQTGTGGEPPCSRSADSHPHTHHLPASLPGDTCQETPGHRVLAEPGQMRGTSRSW